MPEFYIGLNSDIVFLLNVTGSMSNSLPSLKIILTNLAQKIEEEVKKISHSDNARYKVCGFRDQECDSDKWFIEFPFVRNIEEVSNHLNHKDMEPFGGTGKATSLLDAIYKIGMMPVNASKTIEDSNKWRRSGCGTRHIILIFTDTTFKNATLPEISGFGCFEIYNKIADKKLILFGLVPEWIGYDDLGAFPNSRFNYYIKEAEYADLGKPSQEGDAAKLATQQALDKFFKEGDGFESLLESLRTKIFATSSRHPDYNEKNDDLSVLSDEEAKGLGESPGELYLNGLTTLSENAAGYLSAKKSSLFLNGLTTLTGTAAENLGNSNLSELSLGSIQELSEAAARGLSKVGGKLYLKGLKMLSDAAAKALCSCNGQLIFYSLNELTDSPGHIALAKKLASKGEDINFPLLTSLSDGAAEVLGNHRGKLNLSSLAFLSEASAKSLGRHHGDLDLSSVASLSDQAAESLSRHHGELVLSKVSNLTDYGVMALVKHNGRVNLSSLINVSDKVAEILATEPNYLLVPNIDCSKGTKEFVKLALKNGMINQLVSLTKEGAQELLTFNKGTLELSKLKNLTEDVAEVLATYNGELEFYQLNELSEMAAKHLSKHVGRLNLMGLTSLSDECFKHLSKHKGWISFYRIESLSDIAAEYLSSHNGGLNFSTLKNISAIGREHLKRNKEPVVGVSNEGRSDDLNQTNTPTAQQFPNGMNVGFTNDTVIEAETRKDSETEPEKIAGDYKGSRIDIVFLLDVTGSMEKCLALLKLNLINFIKSIEDKLKDGSNYGEIILNARYKVCGFRDQEFDGDKWFIEFPFVRNIEEVSNHLNHRDMEPFGGTGKATSLLDAIYKIGMMPVNASKTLEDSNKWRGGTRHWIFLVSNSTFKNATIPEIAGFGYEDIYNKIADKKLILFGLVPEWSGYDDLAAWPNSRFICYIKEAEYADLGKPGQEGDAAKLANQQALDKFSIEGNGFESLFESLREHIKNVFEIDDDLEKIDIEDDINFENLSNEERSDDLNQTNTPTDQQLPNGMNVGFTNDTVIEAETRKDSETEPEKIAGALKGLVDIVFLLDVTGGREPCLNAIKSNLTNFAQTIADNLEGGVNGPVITLDVRYKVCGYRDQSCDGDKWFIEFPFVRNIEEVKTHINHPNMSSYGGGDQPESLLDGLYKVGMMPVCESKEPEDPTKWRKGAMHCVLIFTDATFKNATLPEIEGFGVADIYNKIADKKLVLFGLVPEWSGYDDLSAWPNSQITNYINGPAVANLGKSGPEGDAAGAAAITACRNMSLDKDTFKSFMEILAKAISRRFCKHN